VHPDAWQTPPEALKTGILAMIGRAWKQDALPNAYRFA
jgi:hypothetical protein